MKKTNLLRNFLLSILFFTGIFCADLSASTKSAQFYLQSNAVFNINSTFKLDLTSLKRDEDGQEIETRNIIYLDSALFDSFYNANFIVGYHFANDWAFELELTNYDIYFVKVDGEAATAGDRTLTLTSVNYNMMNFKYDFLTMGNYTAFIKVGVGIGVFDTPARNGSGGNDVEFAAQGVIGMYYSFNRYLDFEFAYKYLKNIADREMVASTTINQALYFTESSIYGGIRLNLDF